MLNTQYINLNMIPSGIMPVLYCSQYDVGRPLGFVVNNGSEVVNLDQYMVAIEGTRSDGTGIVADVNTNGNIGVFLTTATMTNKSDIYDMQLVIRSTDTHRVASIPFMMHVRTAALDENSSVIEEDKSLFQQYTETVMIAIAEIRSDVESEATARSNADSTLLERINIEAADRAAEDNALNDRINNIIAPGGAPSAAEVTDARLGADGVLYDTLGEAIRTQFDDVYKNLAYTVNLESDISGLLVVDGGIGGTVPTSLTAKLEPQQTGSGAPSADNIRPFVQFTSLSMLHAGESGGGGSGNPPTMPFWGGTQNCITGEWTLYQYNSNYDGIGDMTDVRWWSDRDVYVPGTNPSVGAYVVYEPTTPMRTSGQPWGAEAMYSGINQYLMTAYDSVTQTRVPFTLNIETDVANVGDVVDGIAHDVSTLQSDMDQTNQALTLLRNEYDITASTVTVHTTLIENNAEDIAENTADISQLNSRLNATEIVDSASGAIASFPDGANGIPVRGLTVNIEPTQSGTGDPSPENVRPISGHTAVTVTRTAVNMFGGTLMRDGVKAALPTSADHPEDGYIAFSSTSTAVSNITANCGLTGKFKENTQYTFIFTLRKSSGTSGNLRIYYTDSTYTGIGVTQSGEKETTVVVTSPGKTVYSFNKYNSGGTTYLYYNESGIFEGVHTAEDFVPYGGEQVTVQLGDTVYGGSLDVTNGVLTVDRTKITIDGSYTPSAINTNDVRTSFRLSLSNTVPLWQSLGSAQLTGAIANWATERAQSGGHTPSGISTPNGFALSDTYASYRQIGITISSEYTTEEQINAYLNANPLEICYRMRSPLTIQLVGQTLSTLKGQNNIWSDARNVSVDYVADTKLFIEQLTEPDADMIADANITSGQYFMVGNGLYLATANIANGSAIVPGTNCTRTNLAAALNALNA